MEKREREAIEINDVLNAEREIIKKKRGKESISSEPQDLFGIALSGGGIRSATIATGILDILNQAGVLAKADYLSTVSGGSFIGGYMHARLWREQEKSNPYGTLFDPADIHYFQHNGDYLVPGKKTTKILSYLRSIGVILFGLPLNLLWFVSLLFTLYFFLQIIGGLIFNIHGIAWFLGVASGLVFIYHFFFHGLRKIKIGNHFLWSSNVLSIIEGSLVLLILLYVISTVAPSGPIDAFIKRGLTIIQESIAPIGVLSISRFTHAIPMLSHFLFCFLIFLMSALFYNPNILSMHRFYRDMLSGAYLETSRSGKKNKYLKLAELNANRRFENGEREWNGPYPLINTCLNLLGERWTGREKKGKKGSEFKEQKVKDYFLLSPLYCGSSRTGYIRTDHPGYRHMTLATAMAISGATFNPNMGASRNRLVAFIMSIFNFKLNYWALNPKKASRHFFLTIWPYYLLKELLCKTSTRSWKINLSDGGHIENLAVYELLRRRCTLIMAVDAGEDSAFDFKDLRKLMIYARNELGIAINFRKDQTPEAVIQPKSSTGFSDGYFVIADVEEIPTEGNREGKKIGVLVYLKSCLKAPQVNKEQLKLESQSYHYKTCHPDFPHESTVDQFFDEGQWEAYYSLGKCMAGDLLKIDDVDCQEKIIRKQEEFKHMSIGELVEYLKQ